jgi:hypothetical protein
VGPRKRSIKTNPESTFCAWQLNVCRLAIGKPSSSLCGTSSATRRRPKYLDAQQMHSVFAFTVLAFALSKNLVQPTEVPIHLLKGTSNEH